MSEQPNALLSSGNVYHGPWAKGPTSNGRMDASGGHWAERSFPLAIDVEYDDKRLEWFCTTFSEWADWIEFRIDQHDFFMHGALLHHESFFEAMEAYGEEIPQEDGNAE